MLYPLASLSLWVDPGQPVASALSYLRPLAPLVRFCFPPCAFVDVLSALRLPLVLVVCRGDCVLVRSYLVDVPVDPSGCVRPSPPLQVP